MAGENLRIERSEKDQVSIYKWDGAQYVLFIFFQAGKAVVDYYRVRGVPTSIIITEGEKTATLSNDTLTDYIVLPDPTPNPFAGTLPDLLVLLRDSFFFQVASSFIGQDGEGISYDGTKLNLGGGLRFTASRNILGDSLNTFDLNINDFRIFAGLNTFSGLTGINAAWLRSNNGFSELSGGAGVLIKTKKVNNLTASLSKYAALRLIDPSTGESEYTQTIFRKLASQTTTLDTHTPISQMVVPIEKNSVYRITGIIRMKSDNPLNGIGFSFVAMAAFIEGYLSVEIPTDADNSQTFSIDTAGAGGNTLTSPVDYFLVKISAIVISSGNSGNFQLSFKSAIAGNSISILNHSHLKAEQLV